MVGPNAPTSSSRSGQCSVLNCLHNSGIFAVEGFDSAVFVVRVARPAMCLGSARRDSGLRDIPTGLPGCAGAAARLLIGDDDDQVLGASLLQAVRAARPRQDRSEEHTSELQSRLHLVCRLLLEKKKKKL